MDFLLLVFSLVAAVSFVAGAKYGRGAEQTAIAEIVKAYDSSAAEAVSMLSLVRAHVVTKLDKV